MIISPMSTEKTLNENTYFIIRESEGTGYKNVSISSNFFMGFRGHMFVFPFSSEKTLLLECFC